MKLFKTIETNIRFEHHLCAIMGGFLAGYSLLNRVKFLATAQTTNLIYLVLDLCGHNFSESILRAIALFIFIFSNFTYVFLKEKTKLNIKYVAVIVNFLCFTIIGLLPDSVTNIVAWYPAFFMVAFQWNAFPGAYGYASATIFSTNNVKQASLSLAEYCFGKKKEKKSLHRAGFFLTSILSFYIGVVLSYFASKEYADRSILLDCIFLIPLIVLIHNERNYAK